MLPEEQKRLTGPTSRRRGKVLFVKVSAVAEKNGALSHSFFFFFAPN